MNGTYRTTLAAHVIGLDGVGWPAIVELLYEGRHNPYVVFTGITISGRPQVWWHLSRDLLRDGLVETAGIADVQIAPDGHGHVIVALSTNHGRAELQLDASDLAAFVRRIDRMLRPGLEEGVIDWDADYRALVQQ